MILAAHYDHVGERSLSFMNSPDDVIENVNTRAVKEVADIVCDIVLGWPQARSAAARQERKVS